MTFTIVRHAHAGQRSQWVGDDRLRPLSEKGETEAKLIAEHLRNSGSDRLLTSPAVRCRQTLEPLGRDFGLDVEVDDRLFEGPREPWLSDLILESLDANVTVCSHGDVIPVLLDLLIDDGLPAPKDMRCHKASIWTVERENGAWTTASYWRARA